MPLYEERFYVEAVEATWKVVVRDSRTKNSEIDVHVIVPGRKNIQRTFSGTRPFLVEAESTEGISGYPATDHGRAEMRGALCRIFLA